MCISLRSVASGIKILIRLKYYTVLKWGNQIQFRAQCYQKYRIYVKNLQAEQSNALPYKNVTLYEKMQFRSKNVISQESDCKCRMRILQHNMNRAS